ncbi:MAG TPA: hypothetical protein DEH78_25390, partial [Solibacterales bacterium]|nr:hypothetical protein [Bryobacterales bacterium]
MAGPISPELWARASEILADATGSPPEERAALIAGRCGGDGELQSLVERLLSQHDRAGVLDQTPSKELFEGPRLPAGMLLADRFEVVRFLGRGGMGEVYEARDTALEDRVAIKLLRPAISGDAAMLSRFRREIRLSRRITHPNVCRVFDVFGEPPLVFYSMELLEGVTLAGYLREHGPLSGDAALSVAGQIAAALGAAHEADVAHRDLKPGNVFIGSLAGRLHARVLDFGLAQSQAEGHTVTRTGPHWGTPGYMAPEQWLGGKAGVAADIYAYGALLRETVAEAGEPPWRAVIARCLEDDPAARYPSIAAAFADLSGRRAPRFRPARRWFAVAAASLGAASLGAAFFRFRQWRPDAGGGVMLLLTPIQNATGDAELQGLGPLLSEALSQSPSLHLLSGARLQTALRRMGREGGGPPPPAVLREAAMREEADIVLFAAATRLGDEYTVQLRMEWLGRHPALAETVWKRDFTAGSKSDLFRAVHAAARWVREQAGEASADLSRGDRPPQDVTTSSWEALRLFADAERKKLAGDAEGAIALFEEALRADASFALAAMRVADVRFSRFEWSAGYPAWRRAIELSTKRQLSTREALRIRGLYAEDLGDYEAALSAFQVFAAQYPKDYLAHFYLASSMAHMGRWREAAQEFRLALACRERTFDAAVHLGGVSVAAGDLDGAAWAAAQVQGLGQPRWAALLDGMLAVCRLDPTRAGAVFQALTRDVDVEWQSRAWTLLGSLEAERGQTATALRAFERALAIEEQRANRPAQAAARLALASLLRRAGQPGEAERHCRQALVLDASPSTLLRAGSLLAGLGFDAEAAKAAAAIPAGIPAPLLEVARLKLRGELELARGRAVAAVGHFRAAARFDSALNPPFSLARALAAAGD